MLNLHMQDQHKKIALKEELFANWALFLTLFKFMEFVFNDEVNSLDFWKLGQGTRPLVVLCNDGEEGF